METEPGRGGRILVVEDDPDVADLVRFLLEDEGYRVDLATTQAEAFSKMPQAELTLLDVVLPDGSAHTLCRLARSTLELVRHPILLLSDRDRPDERAVAISAGANDHVLKPIDPEELLARVRALVHTQCVENELRRQAQRLSVLRHLTTILINTVEVPELAQRVVDAVPLLFSGDSAFLGGILSVIDAGTRSLRPYAITGGALGRDVTRLLAHPLHHYQTSYDPPINLLQLVAYQGQVQEAARLADFLAPNVPPGVADQIEQTVALRGGVAMAVRAQGKVTGVLLFLLGKPVAEITPLERDLMDDFVGTIGIALENVRLYAEAARMMVTDPLTGLANRRCFDRVLAEEIARARRLNYPVGLLIADVDHFKACNDRHGHLIGDQVLREIGQVLHRSVRQTDLVARYGGEEFAVILPGAAASGLQTAAQKLRQATCSLAIEGVPDLAPPTLSVGGAAASAEDLSADTLMSAADAALYAAKNAGRDRIIIATKC